MNTTYVHTNSEHTEETIGFFPELRTIPTGWDLSNVPGISQSNDRSFNNADTSEENRNDPCQSH